MGRTDKVVLRRPAMCMCGGLGGALAGSSITFTSAFTSAFSALLTGASNASAIAKSSSAYQALVLGVGHQQILITPAQHCHACVRINRSRSHLPSFTLAIREVSLPLDAQLSHERLGVG